MAKKMTAKQKRFCTEYMVDMNGKQAAIRAGYKKESAEVQASKMLSKGKVSQKIAELKEKQSEKTLVTAEWIVKGLRDVAIRCRQGEPVFDKEGTPTGEWKFDSSGANRALELLGKHVDIFKGENPLKGLLDGATITVQKTYVKKEDGL